MSIPTQQQQAVEPSHLQEPMQELAALRAAHEALEQRLRAEIAGRRLAEEDARRSREALRAIASELTLAEERERRAIATDLHDHLGQALAMIRIKLGEIRGNAIFEGFGDTIGRLCSFVDEAITYTRTLTFELSSPLLYELGLEAAVESLAERMRAKYGIPIAFAGGAERLRIDQDVAVLLFKATRELLMNAVKHAKATRVTVALDQCGEEVRVSVADDGVGFDAAHAPERLGLERGFGLVSIRERLRSLSGRLEITSTPERGTTAILCAPLTAPTGGPSKGARHE